MEFKVQEVPFLEEVYRPSEQRPEIDLVFVHGLNPFSNINHAYDTWTHSNGTFWPYQFLPQEIPEARIWVYGYNSNVAKEVSEARIKDHADVLLDRLQRKRKEGRKHGTIPIIFVGHSLGGLVIKQALLNAKDNEFFKPTRLSTYGLVFFGTPHRGGRGGAFGSLAAKIAKFISADRADNDLLKCLESNSLFTQEASERFSHQLEKYKVISFFETIPMKLGVRGISEIVVDRQSAVLELAGSRERREALNADHSSMCKLGNKGPMYDGIAGKIKDMVDEALDWYDSKSDSLNSVAQNQTFLNPGTTERGRSLSAAPSPVISPIPDNPMLEPPPQRGRSSSAVDAPLNRPAITAPQPVSVDFSDSAMVIYAYKPLPQDVDDLELTLGDIITNIDRKGQTENWVWWHGTNSNGQSGTFPCNYVKLIPRPPGQVENLLGIERPPLRTQEQASSISLPIAERVTSPSKDIPSSHRELGSSLSEADLSVMTGEVLHGANCDNCMQQIRGVRHKCMDCPDWDYCAGCIRRAPFLHNPAHRFQPIYEVEVAPEAPTQPATAASQSTPTQEQDAASTNELARQMEYLANAIILSTLVDSAATVNTQTTTQGEVPATTKEIQEPAASVVEGVPLPTRMAIPQCSVCKIWPEEFPVLTCETCWGKTIICRSCGLNLHLNPSNPHKNHKFRLWLDGLWFEASHIYLKTLVAPVNQYGPEWAINEIETINLGINLMGKTSLLEFSASPYGSLRIALLTVPPGQWEVSFQISTWPSPGFGEAEVDLLRFSKKLSVRASTTSVGFVQAYVGTPIDAANYLDHEHENPVQQWADNSIRHRVAFGTFRAQKMKFPKVLVVGEKKEVAFYLQWFRNSEAFTKEKPEVQQRLGFCWRLEGIKVEMRQDI